MSRTRRSYDKEFKLMAVEFCQTGKTATEVAQELGVARDLVSRWNREYSNKGTGSFSGNGNANLSPEEKEIQRLKKELREAQIERDILKKAVSIFSKSDGKNSNL